MIHINLLPGSGKKTKARAATVDLGAFAAGVLANVKDPFLTGAVAVCGIAVAVVALLYTTQASAAASLDAQLRAAEQDSIRFAAVIKEKRRTEAQRDSVLTQLTLIRSIDSKRFVWPHIMDEMSRALPPYTWLTQVTQTVEEAPKAAPAAPGPKKGKGKATPDSLKRKTPKEFADSLEAAGRVKFQIVGNTVDLQALTRFMRLLEGSPFIEDVQLVKSAMIVVDGKEVTEFQLNAAYQRPDSAAIRTVPLSVSVR